MTEQERALAAEVAAVQIERIDDDILAARERRDAIEPGWSPYRSGRPGSFRDACLEVDRLISIRHRIDRLGMAPAALAAKIRNGAA